MISGPTCGPPPKSPTQLNLKPVDRATPNRSAADQNCLLHIQTWPIPFSRRSTTAGPPRRFTQNPCVLPSTCTHEDGNRQAHERNRRRFRHNGNRKVLCPGEIIEIHTAERTRKTTTAIT